MRSKRAQLAGAVLFMAALFAGALWLQLEVSKPDRKDLLITGGAGGGTYVRVAEQLKRILEERPGDHIGKVAADGSEGSIKNIDRVADGSHQLGMAGAAILGDHPRGQRALPLARLYDDHLLIVVRHRPSTPRTVQELAGLRVFLGVGNSGTRWLAEHTLAILGAAVPEDRVDDAGDFDEAAGRLIEGSVDAAFFVGAKVTTAVLEAMRSGCCSLLSLGGGADQLAKRLPGLEVATVARQLYPHQRTAIRTVRQPALLIAQADLPAPVAADVLTGLFDGVHALVAAHVPAQEVRPGPALDLEPLGLGVHPGVTLFEAQDQGVVTIATGVLGGARYRLGERIQLVLRRHKIPARVSQTDGSVENARLLRDRPNVLAMLPHDLALASQYSPRLYRSEAVAALDIPSVPTLRRVATLHEEKLHIIARRDRLPGGGAGPLTVTALDGKHMATGPPLSSTHVLATAVLEHHHIDASNARSMQVSEMIRGLHSGQLDAGFFAGHVPSEALKTLLHDRRLRLLPIESARVASMLGPALALSRIPESTYGAQRPGEGAVETLVIRALLAAKKDSEFAARVTAALIDGVGYLGVQGAGETLASDLSSLTLHADADAAFQEAGLRPEPRSIDWFQLLEKLGAALAVLLAGWRTLLTQRRNRTGKSLTRRIMDIGIDGDESAPITKLEALRRNARARHRLRWWEGPFLDRGRLKELEELVADRIAEARIRLNRRLLVALRELRESDAGPTAAAELERRLWRHLEQGDLSMEQHGSLLELLRDLS